MDNETLWTGEMTDNGETIEADNGEAIETAGGEIIEADGGEAIEMDSGEAMDTAGVETIEMDSGEAIGTVDGETIEMDSGEAMGTVGGEAMGTDNGETMGTVKWFSRLKGWGFIEPDGGDRDVFVHYENIVGDGFRNLEKGERVRFRIEDTPRGPKALEVVPMM